METLNKLLSLVGVLAAIVFVIKMIHGSENRLKLLGKAVATGVVIWLYLDLRRAGPFGMLFAIALFIFLAVIWWADVGEVFGGFIASGLTGGGKVDKTALLSKVESLRKTGRYEDAIDEAQEQLKRFKNDFDCYMLIAAIQVEDMGNLEVGVHLVESVLANNKKLDRQQIVYALNTLADWHLKFGKNPDAARGALEQIIELFPTSRASQSAESRIAHLADRESLEAANRPRPAKVMPKFERDLGLKGKKPDLIKAVDPNQLTDEYLAQLEAHPNDWDTRERLAAHYIEHYGNVACAVAELETLVRAKLAGKEDRCRWLHQIADWQAKISGDTAAAQDTLKRIITKYPGSAQAQRAEQAMQFMKRA